MRNREAAEDVFQEASIRAFTKIHQLESEEKFPQWFGRICENQAKNYLRARHLRFESLNDNHIEEMRSENLCPIEKEKSLKRIELFCDLLPYRQRVAFELRVIHELEFNEIAWVMDTAYNTAKGNYRQALLKYINHLSEDGLPVKGE